VSWEVEYTDELETWWSELDEDDQEKVTAAVEVLEEHGPNLKRPVVGKIEGSRHGNMKELIPPASNIRILFAFGPRPNAILLLGGDKTGEWDKWYDENVPIADALYDVYLDELREEGLI
jgi:hypothetical protein